MPLDWRLRDLLARLLPRSWAVRLGIRRLSPRGNDRPSFSVEVTPLDTGGGYRAKHRMQNPSKDPSEPYGGEGSSVGEDHGWSGCTMSAGADVIAYQQPRGGLTPWGGDLRHRQSDLSGGTDLYDLRTAWAEYGESLTIKSGSGWSALVDAHNAGRAIVAQGEGNVPGSETYDGAHACAIGPETNSAGDWLFGDPLASDWQWVPPGKVRTWMENLCGSGLCYAAGEKPPADPPPEPTPTPPPLPPVDPYVEERAAYLRGVRDGEATHADRVFRSWSPGRPFEPPHDVAGAQWGYADWSGAPKAQGDPWASWPLPLDAVYRAQYPAEWSRAGWAASVWRG